MKVAVFYYTQSGQALTAAQNICAPIEKSGSVIYKRIIPQHTYPFPWSSEEFFDAMPETRLGLPPSGICPMDFDDITDADIVMIVGQSWFLSPSLPLQSFFADEQVRTYLKGRDIVFVNVCRNMWVTTLQSIRTYISDIGANLIGHIVLQDNHPNLISALTVVRWLLHGKKETTTFLPAAGVSERDLIQSECYGFLLVKMFNNGILSRLQEIYEEAEAVKYKPSIVFIEKAGHKIFAPWARFIRRKGGMGEARRKRRVRLFTWYLSFVLFVLSPFAQLFFYLTCPFRNMSRIRQTDCRLN